MHSGEIQEKKGTLKDSIATVGGIFYFLSEPYSAFYRVINAMRFSFSNPCPLKKTGEALDKSSRQAVAFLNVVLDLNTNIWSRSGYGLSFLNYQSQLEGTCSQMFACATKLSELLLVCYIA